MTMKTSTSDWLHNLAHKLGLTSGHMDHFKDSEGVWWIGLKCPKCGRFTDPIKSIHQEMPSRP